MNRRDQNRAGDSGVSFGAQAKFASSGTPIRSQACGIERGWHLHHLQLAGAQAVDDLRERGDFVTLFGRGESSGVPRWISRKARTAYHAWGGLP